MENYRRAVENCPKGRVAAVDLKRKTETKILRLQMPKHVVPRREYDEAEELGQRRAAPRMLTRTRQRDM